MLAAQRASRRASNQEASGSGRQQRAPEDAVFDRFNSLVDDWLVTLTHCHPPLYSQVLYPQSVHTYVHAAGCRMFDTSSFCKILVQMDFNKSLLVQLDVTHLHNNAAAPSGTLLWKDEGSILKCVLALRHAVLE